MIVVGLSPNKGRGVFATRRIGAGEVIEEGPVIVMPVRDIEHLERTALMEYLLQLGP